MQLAAILLGLAALGGLAMVGIRASKNQNPPTALAVGHGLIAAAGLITLIYHRLTVTAPPMPNEVNYSIGVLVVAALGGIGMFTLFHLRNRLIPLAFMLGHGLIAAVGLGLLLWAMYGK
jgi:lysozyme family protein